MALERETILKMVESVWSYKDTMVSVTITGHGVQMVSSSLGSVYVWPDRSNPGAVGTHFARADAARAVDHFLTLHVEREGESRETWAEYLKEHPFGQ